MTLPLKAQSGITLDRHQADYYDNFSAMLRNQMNFE